MIDYELIQFACPPHVGAEWFIKTAQLAGFGPGFAHSAYEPFPPSRSSGTILRVSLVRNPADWLVEYFDNWCLATNHVGPLARLPKVDWEGFLCSYLQEHQGYIGRMYQGYESDTVLRIEDMPWALLELLRSLGIGEEYLNLVRRRRAPACPVRQWDLGLRKRVLEAERETCNAYDYF